MKEIIKTEGYPPPTTLYCKKCKKLTKHRFENEYVDEQEKWVCTKCGGTKLR